MTPVEKNTIKQDDQFSKEEVDGLEIPIYIEKKIELDIKQNYDVDLVGWSQFKRLALVQK